MQNAPQGLQERVQWLIDRALIDELWAERARCLDSRNWQGLQDLYVEGGHMQLPYDRIPADQMAGRSEEHLGHYLATVHMSGNRSIDIEGDEAKVRSYFFAAHVTSEDMHEHGDVGGWYDATLRRVDGKWKFEVLEDFFLWKSGGRLPDEVFEADE